MKSAGKNRHIFPPAFDFVGRFIRRSARRSGNECQDRTTTRRLLLARRRRAARADHRRPGRHNDRGVVPRRRRVAAAEAAATERERQYQGNQTSDAHAMYPCRRHGVCERGGRSGAMDPNRAAFGDLATGMSPRPGRPPSSRAARRSWCCSLAAVGCCC